MAIRKQRGVRKSMTAGQLKIVVAVLCVLIMAVVATSWFVVRKSKQEAAADVAALNNQLRSATRLVYKAKLDISQGDCITKDMIDTLSVMVDVDPGLLMSEADFGKIAAVDIPAGSLVMGNMVSADIAANYRERECSFIWLNTNLLDNDFVDVRILFPNGEDYVVLSKKSIKNPSIAINNVFLWLTEDEIELLDAAVVDANLHLGKIYTTRYVRPAIQSAATVTYQPNVSVMQVMNSNPDVVQTAKAALSSAARRGMETRINQFKEENPDFVFNDTLEIVERRQLEAEAYADGNANTNANTNAAGAAGDTAGADNTADVGGEGVTYVE